MAKEARREFRYTKVGWCVADFVVRFRSKEGLQKGESRFKRGKGSRLRLLQGEGHRLIARHLLRRGPIAAYSLDNSHIDERPAKPARAVNTSEEIKAILTILARRAHIKL